MTVFYPAQPALSRCPQRAVAIEQKIFYNAVTQPIRGCVRFAYLTIFEMRHSAIEPEAKPRRAWLGIRNLNGRKLLTPELRPRRLLDRPSLEQLNQGIVVAE